MGDPSRFKVFADFIERTYSDAVMIADVAGGSGYLSAILKKRGYDCTIIDPKASQSSERHMRVSGIKIPVERKPYLHTDATRFDLIVGMHPDEATEEICKSASFKDIAIVPCCNMWEKGKGNIDGRIRKYLYNEGTYYDNLELPMKGKRTLIFNLY